MIGERHAGLVEHPAWLGCGPGAEEGGPVDLDGHLPGEAAGDDVLGRWVGVLEQLDAQVDPAHPACGR